MNRAQMLGEDLGSRGMACERTYRASLDVGRSIGGRRAALALSRAVERRYQSREFEVVERDGTVSSSITKNAKDRNHVFGYFLRLCDARVSPRQLVEVSEWASQLILLCHTT